MKKFVINPKYTTSPEEIDKMIKLGKHVKICMKEKCGMMPIHLELECDKYTCDNNDTTKY